MGTQIFRATVGQEGNGSRFLWDWNTIIYEKSAKRLNVSKMKPYVSREGEDPMDVVIDADGTVEQEVRGILDRRRVNRRYEYLIEFVGQPKSDVINLPRSELRKCMELFREFDTSITQAKLKKN